MVDDLEGAIGFAVHQTLHGYSEGHRLLAGSITLPTLEARAMLVFSDVSGSAKLPDTGYLTGYPLTGSGKFVLARTWAAPEMQRPGCVWTHSLLIDFADLAALRSTAPLTALLRKPRAKSFEVYGTQSKIIRPLTMPDVQTPVPKSGKALLGALYSKADDRVVGSYGGEEDEQLVLEIWMQQWPRLRRGFRFCSFSAADRSTAADPFDLQLVEGNETSHRVRMTGARRASEEQFLPEMMPLLNDLSAPDQDGLRTFLRNVGGDISDGRGAMLPLTRLFSAIGSGAHGNMDMPAAVGLLEEIGPAQARGARRLVVERALEDIESLDSGVFRFVVDNLPADDEPVGDELAGRLGRSMWARSPAMFADALGGQGNLARAASLGLQSMDRTELTGGLKVHPEAAADIATRRRDLLADPSFWHVSGIRVAEVLRQADVRSEDTRKVIDAVIAGERGEAAEILVRQFGAADLIDAVSAAPAGVALNPWFTALRGHTGELSDALARGVLRRRSAIIALARAIAPDSLGGVGDRDPWISALELSEITADDDGEDFLAAFILSRGLGRRSPTPGRLMALSFDRVHASLAANRMPSSGWRFIQDRLPWTFPWQEWDRCGRVREAVVERFVDGNLPAHDLAALTVDEGIWHSISKLAARTGRGRRLLERAGRG